MTILSAEYKLKQFAYSRSFPGHKLDTKQDIEEFEHQVEESDFDGDEMDEISEDDLRDALSELRDNYDEETVIPCDYSRNYESKSVAKKMKDGTWIGWTFWYGGGKHGEPEAIDWIEHAYYLDCNEEEKVVTVRTFTKK